MYRACLILIFPTLAFAQTLTVKGGKDEATNVVLTSGGKPVAIIPMLKAGESVSVESQEKAKSNYSFKETAGEYVDLLDGSKPVLRFVNKPRDEKNHYMTFKPFHQVFDPAKGETLLSSGAHPLTKDFLFPHHRGLYFGFNRISYGDKKSADIWHGTKNVYSNCDKIVEATTGGIYAKQVSAISWHGEAGDTFADEQRTVVVYNVKGGTMLDWSTNLTTKLDKVRLDGDPQHAGFHFRATQEVAKTTAKQTYYLRPDGKGKEGETRNWDAKGKNVQSVNMPWNAMSFVVGGKRYTTVRINHPENPKETRGSERDYGRFGDYFEFDLTPKTPLNLKYRVWVQEGEMTVEQCNAMYHGFVDSVTVK